MGRTKFAAQKAIDVVIDELVVQPFGLPQQTFTDEPDSLGDSDAGEIRGRADQLDPIHPHLAKAVAQHFPNRQSGNAAALITAIQEVTDRSLAVLSLDILEPYTAA